MHMLNRVGQGDDGTGAWVQPIDAISGQRCYIGCLRYTHMPYIIPSHKKVQKYNMMSTTPAQQVAERMAHAAKARLNIEDRLRQVQRSAPRRRQEHHVRLQQESMLLRVVDRKTLC